MGDAILGMVWRFTVSHVSKRSRAQLVLLVREGWGVTENEANKIRVAVIDYLQQRDKMRAFTRAREEKRVAEAAKLPRCKRCGQAVPREGTRVCNEAKGMECEE